MFLSSNTIQVRYVWWPLLAAVFSNLFITVPILDAQFFPTTRYLTRSSPFSPTSYDQCAALDEEFAEDVRTLSAHHDQCLADAPRQESSVGGLCSKPSCQALHTARDHASEKRRQEVQTCRTRVNDYLAKQRRKEDAARRSAEESERDRQKREKETEGRQKDREEREAVEQAKQIEHSRREDAERAEKDRQAKEEQAENARRAEQEMLQRYTAAVAQTANQVKQEWISRLRAGLPDVAEDIGAFIDASRSMVAGEKSPSVAELIVVADNLLERSEATHAWITSPLATISDQITSDAIRIVRADPGLQEADVRLSTIFHGVKKMNEVAHSMNPFTKSISSLALAQIEEQYDIAVDSLNHIEKEVGSFDSSGNTHGGQSLVNPFLSGQRPSSRQVVPGDGSNPFSSSSSVSETSIAEQNPFRQGSASILRSAETKISPSSMANGATENPFSRGGQSKTAVGSSASVASGAVPKIKENNMVRYRDPLTKKLSVKRRNELPASGLGDDLNGAHCSADGLGVITDKCEDVRSEKAKRSNPTP